MHGRNGDRLEHVSRARREALQVGRAQGGDTEAYAELVHAHQEQVQRWLFARCPPGIEAEDVAQQAFLVAWKHLQDYRGDGAFRTWLIGIAGNILRREYRQLQQRSRLHAHLADLARTDDRPTEGLQDELAQLEECLQELDPTLETLVDLHYRQQWRLAGIASRLGQPLGTIKRQLHQARRVLSACIRRRQQKGPAA